MKPTTFIFLHAVGVAAGAAALWWFVFPSSLGEAVADAVTAGAVASYVELVAMRRGL
ncbi:MAG TPA: hypothetical protein VHL98_10920 [Microvirga sp.]|jgi:hypothetical protein|nr:hypothetical protein [Microvirga sp.]